MSQEVGKPYQLFMHHVSTKIPKHLILQFQVGIGRQQHSACVKGCLVQLNEYETAPYFIQLSQDTTRDCFDVPNNFWHKIGKNGAQK